MKCLLVLAFSIVTHPLYTQLRYTFGSTIPLADIHTRFVQTIEEKQREIHSLYSLLNHEAERIKEFLEKLLTICEQKKAFNEMSIIHSIPVEL